MNKMLLLHICATLTLLIQLSTSAMLDVECRGEGTAMRDDTDLSFYWRCGADGQAQEVVCSPGRTVPCDVTMMSDVCPADPCSESRKDSRASVTCPEYEPPQDTQELDGETVDQYIEYCFSQTGEVSETQLAARTSTRCDPPQRDIECEQPASGYIMNQDIGFCERGESCDVQKVFSTAEECQFTCEDACEQKVHPGEEDCDVEGRQLHYYYDERSGECRKFYYSGCGGNKNRFENEEECFNLCRADNIEPTQSTAATTSTTQRIIKQEPLPLKPIRSFSVSDRGKRAATNEDNPQAFCKEVEAAFPEIRQYIEAIQDTSLNQINTVGLADQAKAVDDMVVDPSNSEVDTSDMRVKRQFNPFGLIPRRIHWATVIRRRACKTFDVRVRIFCVGAIFRGPPNSDERKRLCDLIASGIEKYWSRQINIYGSVWNMQVTVKQTWFLSKKIVIKYYNSNSGNTRSHNSDILPMTMKYLAYRSDTDKLFEETAAHEMAHSILMNSQGLVWSWGHKGTSTIFGSTTAATTPYPTTGEIDIMKYHTGAPPSNYYSVVKLAEDDAIALLNEATFFFRLPWCPGGFGAPCWSDSQCISGHCHWLRCVACKRNSDCSLSMYCHGINNPFLLNTCRPLRAIGQFCVRDNMCASGMCDGARCVPCEQDSHCPAGQYCQGKNNAIILNNCRPLKPRGALCLRDGVCTSGRCSWGRCVDCESDAHCPSNQYCWGTNVPLTVNECRPRLGLGSLCLRDRVCASNMCHGGRCGECESDSHCPSDEYCKNKNIPLVTNRCSGKKCRGWCSRNAMCKSGNCRWFGRCKKC